MSSTNTPTPDQLETNQERTGDSTSMQSLLEVNNLSNYKLPPSLSVVVARSHKMSHFQKEEYVSGAGLPFSFTLSSGGDYVYGPDSFITFDLEVTTAGTVSNGKLSFGKDGSILNVFQNCRITHADGTELDNIRNANVCYTNNVQWETTDAWRKGPGELMGYRSLHKAGSAKYDQTRKFVDVKDTTPSSEVSQATYLIPLGMLSDLFNQDVLLPSFLVAGLRVELDLEDPYRVFQVLDTSATAASGSYTTLSYKIKNPRLWLDQHTLSDSILKGLAVESSSRGLDVPWNSKWVDSKTVASGAQDTFQVTKALSRVNSVTLVPRLKSSLNTTDTDVSTGVLSVSSLAPESVFDVTNYQFNVGSQYIPSHPVTNVAMAIKLANQGRDNEPSVGYYEFVRDGSGIARCQIERSQILRGSGLAINANRGASMSAKYGTTGDKDVTLIADHTKLATVFLDNIAVRS